MINLPAEVSEILTKLNEHQLRQLNLMILERLKLFGKAKQMKTMIDLNIGDAVFFDYYGEEIAGTIKRLNQKTVTLITSDGKEWKVSPTFLKKFIDV